MHIPSLLINYDRTGSLFEKPFHRKRVNSEKYLRKLILYIHNNPVHHRVCNEITDYKWSSYKSYISEKPGNLNQSEVIEMFGDLDNFIFCHSQHQDIQEVKFLLFD